jgi:hypothetical protein
VETFGVPLLKTKDFPASDLSNCEGSADAVLRVAGKDHLFIGCVFGGGVEQTQHTGVRQSRPNPRARQILLMAHRDRSNQGQMFQHQLIAAVLAPRRGGGGGLGDLRGRMSFDEHWSAIFPIDGNDGETLLASADRRMYRVKNEAKESGAPSIPPAGSLLHEVSPPPEGSPPMVAAAAE